MSVGTVNDDGDGNDDEERNTEDDDEQDAEDDNEANDEDDADEEGGDPNDKTIQTSAAEIVQHLLDLAKTDQPILNVSYALRYWLAVVLYRWRSIKNVQNIEAKMSIPRNTVR